MFGAVHENYKHEPVALKRVKPVGGSGAVAVIVEVRNSWLRLLEPVLQLAKTTNLYSVPCIKLFR